MNNQIFYFFYNIAHQSTGVDRLVVFIADTFPYFLVLMVGVFLLFHHEVLPSKNPFKEFAKKWKEIVLVFFSGVLAWLTADVLKILIHTSRPFTALQNVQSLFPETGYAFPSQHATFFAAIVLSVYFVHKRVGAMFIVFALLIGIARIISGVHFPIDILGGFILGSLIAVILNKFAFSKKTI